MTPTPSPTGIRGTIEHTGHQIASYVHTFFSILEIVLFFLVPATLFICAWSFRRALRIWREQDAMFHPVRSPPAPEPVPDTVPDDWKSDDAT